MKININDIKSYCIHLSIRKDREENMYKELNYFVPNQYTIIEAERYTIGKIGVSRSFKMVITEAKKLNLEYVLVFEDDVKFTSDKSREVFQTALDNLPDDWDMLLGGIYTDTKLTDCNEYLKKVESFSALHCVLFRNTMYDKILQHQENGIHTVHLDMYLGNLSRNNEINIYLVYPMIAIQYTGISNTINKDVDYSSYLEKYEILK